MPTFLCEELGFSLSTANYIFGAITVVMVDPSLSSLACQAFCCRASSPVHARPAPSCHSLAHSSRSPGHPQGMAGTAVGGFIQDRIAARAKPYTVMRMSFLLSWVSATIAVAAFLLGFACIKARVHRYARVLLDAMSRGSETPSLILLPLAMRPCTCRLE